MSEQKLTDPLGSILYEFQSLWRRFWRLSWWWKGPLLGALAALVALLVAGARDLAYASRQERGNQSVADVYDTYVAVASGKFDDVQDSIKALDAKAFQSLATGTIVLGVGVTLGGFESAETSSLVFLGLAAIAYASLAFFTYTAAKVVMWSNRPDLATLDEHLHDTAVSFDELRLWTAREYALSVKENEPSLISKGRNTTASIFALSTEVLLLLMGVVLA